MQVRVTFMAIEDVKNINRVNLRLPVRDKEQSSDTLGLGSHID